VRRKWCFALALVLAACEGRIGRLPRDGVELGPGAAGPSPGAAANGTSTGVADVNRVPIHRLNNSEYDNTVHDLLGVTSTLGKTFIADEKLFGFDVIASAFGMTDAQFEQYFDAADALVEETFGSDSLRGRIMTCTSSDATCTKKIIADFGLRAWRRPLETAEVDRLATLASDAMAQGEDFTGGIKHVIRTMLSSVEFLYRVELDPNAASVEPHPVGPYELASRLSYLFWSTMPDDELLAAASTGDLTKTDVLAAEVDRLLRDARARQFVTNFAGQWLGLRDLESHQVDPGVFPNFGEPLRNAMIGEGLAYFDEFLSGGRGLNEFFTADVNFVDASLAELYGFSPTSTTGLMRVTNTGDARRGFVGLSSFLTLTSYSYRTAPTLRGKWVLENLLCEHIEPPPPNVPDLDAMSGDPASLQSENVRKRMEAHRADPKCASCHKVLDPIGLGLENFDAIGTYRSRYANGDDVDASGVLPDGTNFVGLTELTDALSKDTRLTDCVSQKLLTYALSREVVATDAAYLEAIRKDWEADGMGLASLLERIVLSEPFRNRRGESE
jgi:hypothetical protein